MVNTWAATAFLVSLSLFAFTSFFVGRKIKNETEFFTATNSNGSALSVVAGNVTLGTGLVYYITLLGQGWVPALIVPFGVFIGYQLLAGAVRGSKFNPSGSLTLLDYTQQRRDQSQSLLSKSFLVLIPIVFLLIIAAEIYIATPIVVQSLGLNLDENTSMYMAIGIAFCGVLYGVVGGLRGVIFSDVLQFLLASLMITALVIVSFFPEYFGLGGDVKSSASHTLSSIPLGLEKETYFIIGLAFISALTTQFYNIINLGMGSSFDADKSAKMFDKASYITALTLFGLLMVGALLSGSSEEGAAGLGNITRSLLSTNDFPTNLILCLIIFGMMSVLFSSIDSVVILCAHQLRSRFRAKNSAPKETPMIARIFIGIAGASSLGVVVVLFHFKPGILPLFFTVTLPLSLFAPVVLFGFLGKAHDYDTVYSRRIISFLVLIGILVTWGWAVADTLSGNQYVVQNAGTYGVIGVFLFGALDFMWHKKKRPKYKV